MSLLTKAIVLFAFIGLFTGFLLLLPDYELPSEIAYSVELIFSLAMWANAYLPLDTMVEIFKWTIILEVVLWLIKNFQRILGYASNLFG